MKILNEKQMDYFLAVETCGIQQGFHSSFHYHRYEPTPYAALEKLFQAYSVKSSDVLVDYGCGKGRIGFYAHAFHGISSVGVEMDTQFIQIAKRNLSGYIKSRQAGLRKIQFYEGFAQDYIVRANENIFYFFHPFSVQIFIKVVSRILDSLATHPRNVDIILYYPSVDYCEFLERYTFFTRVQEISADYAVHTDAPEYFYVYHTECFG